MPHQTSKKRAQISNKNGNKIKEFINLMRMFQTSLCSEQNIQLTSLSFVFP